MQRFFQILICLILTVAITGCSLVVQPRLVANRELENFETFDPNDYGITIKKEKASDESGEYGLAVEIGDAYHVHLKQPTRIKYVPFARQSIVKGKINNKRYPVLFDTGNPSVVHITTAHVEENNLPVYPLKITDSKGHTHDVGVAIIPSMTIGDIKFCNLPAVYSYYHTGYLPLGIPIILGQNKEVVVPLRVIRKFKYMACDNIKKELEFSADASFKVDDPQGWKTYPLLFEDGWMFIQTSIEGFPAKLMVDTGSQAELFLKESYFNNIAENKPRFGKAWKLNKTAFAPLAGGKTPIKSYFVHGLTFDDYTYSLSTIIRVFKESGLSKLLEDIQCDGIIGYTFFEDTVMVLDFEQEKMWVKKEPKSRFRK